MKKVLLLILLVSMLVSQNVNSLEAPGLSVTLLNQDPDPVSPGRYVELRFKIQNNMPKTTANDLKVMLEPVYPFSLDPNEQAVKSLGNLPSMGDSNSVIVKYKVRVDQRAVQGPNPIILKFKHNAMDWFSQEFLVDIQTVDANVGISNVITNPESIKPGEKAEVSIKVKNMADSVMKDVSLKLDLTFSTILEQKTSLTASDTIVAYNTLPFVPLGSASEQKIDMLLPGEEHVFTYKLAAFPDATSKVYKIPVRISYYDELGTKYTKNDLIGLVVGTKPELSVIIEKTDLVVGKNTGTVMLKFINKGFTDVKFLDVIVNDTDCFKVISASEVYVGNVDSDDYETAEFKVHCTRDIKEETTIDFPVSIQYRDANNNLYRESHILKLKIFSPKVLGQGNGFNPLTIVALVVVAGIVFIFYKRRQRKK